MAPKKPTATDRDVVADDVKPSTPGPRRRRRPERGLPGDEALRDLARTYLQAQRALWPDLVSDGTLPRPEADVVSAMVEEFRRRFLGGATEPIPTTGSAPRRALACSYLRYSSDNSNPRSLDQQLRLQLERAAQLGHFIPWACVFADAAVTGTTADRHGYTAAKQSLGVEGIEALYIDEIGRASRDAIEALRLGRLVDRSGRRLIGVSDGFDSTSPTSKIMLSLFAMLQEWFIDQLRSKVHRGMDDAFGRGTNIHPPSVGYALEPAVDAEGRPLRGKDGEPLRRKVIHPAQAEDVREAFRLFGLEGWSRDRIARRFNEKTVGGKATWDAARVTQLLRRRTYVGIEVYGRTYQVRDPETGHVAVKERPRDQWRVRRARHLQIVPWSLWKAVRRRLEQCRAAYDKRSARVGPSRTELYPKVLIRPRCGSCGSELILGRSGKYASFCCLRGINGKGGCTFKGYKSCRIVDEAILGELHRRVLTEEFLGRVLEEANRFLAEEASRPREDLGPLEAEIRSTRSRRDRLVRLLDEEGDADLGAVVEQVRRHERRLAELNRRLAEMKAKNAPAPPPITSADLEAMLSDLRGLLEQDVAAAAPLLLDLTGPIVIDQVVEPGRKRPTWIAKFTVDAVPILTRIGTASRDCPTRGTWEYLSTRGWTMPERIEARVEATSVRQRKAAEVAALVDKGTSLFTAAVALGISAEAARAALEHARAGRPAAAAVSSAREAGLGEPPPYIRLATEVARLRDEELLSFPRIAGRIGYSEATARRAYDWAHRDDVVSAAAEGRPYRRGRYTRLPAATHAEVARLLAEGERHQEVASRLGCGLSTVYRARRALRSAPALGEGRA
jgi:DNA invertase Pin-like site-specific DNA recombinase